MELSLPENLEDFVIMTPSNAQPEDVLPGGNGILLSPNSPNIMIYKIGRQPFHIIFFEFEASQPVRVIFERESGQDDVRDVSENIEVFISK